MVASLLGHSLFDEEYEGLHYVIVSILMLLVSSVKDSPQHFILKHPQLRLRETRSNEMLNYNIQGYSKRSIHFQKFILQVLLNIWRRAIYKLKGEFSKLCSHLTSTRYEPHVWRGRCKIDNIALSALHITPLGRQNYCVCTWHLAEIQTRTFERFPFHLHIGHGFSVSSFCKINFWKCILF
jgi:hypothetical protein